MVNGKTVSFRLDSLQLDMLQEFTDKHGFRGPGVSAKMIVLTSLHERQHDIRPEQIDLLMCLKQISKAIDFSFQGQYFEVKSTGGKNKKNTEDKGSTL